MGEGFSDKAKIIISAVAVAITLIGATFGATMTFALKSEQEQLVQTVQGLNQSINNTKLAFSANSLIDAAREKVSLLENEKYELRALLRKYATDQEIKDQIEDNKAALAQARKDLEKEEKKLTDLLNK